MWSCEYLLADHTCLPAVLQHTRECLAKIGILAEGHDGEHGQDAIFRLIAAVMHLLNVGFKSGECSTRSSQMD